MKLKLSLFALLFGLTSQLYASQTESWRSDPDLNAVLERAGLPDVIDEITQAGAADQEANDTLDRILGTQESYAIDSTSGEGIGILIIIEGRGSSHPPKCGKESSRAVVKLRGQDVSDRLFLSLESFFDEGDGVVRVNRAVSRPREGVVILTYSLPARVGGSKSYLTCSRTYRQLGSDFELIGSDCVFKLPPS